MIKEISMTKPIPHVARFTFLALLALLSGLAITPAALGATQAGFRLTVLVDGSSRPEYNARGTVYVEALRGRDYSLRITNPTAYRVAVALSVDGLNSIDARHTDARSAAKWVLDPYESTVISGWQVGDSAARQFFFTGEKRSYAAALGQTKNLGVIEAVFFRELRPVRRYGWWDSDRPGVPAPQAEGQRKDAAGSSAEAAPGLSDDYAATGMGDRTRHDVARVDIELDPQPVASLRIRYEFQPELVRLGVLPRIESPRERRERARGFEGYCPEPAGLEK
jgi:hypothetical protein